VSSFPFEVHCFLLFFKLVELQNGWVIASRLRLYFRSRGKQPLKSTEKGGFLELGAWKKNCKSTEKGGDGDLSILDLGLRISDCGKKDGETGRWGEGWKQVSGGMEVSGVRRN